MPFKKGQIGNPQGRPKGSQNKTAIELKQVISEIISNETEELTTRLNNLPDKDRVELLIKKIIPAIVSGKNVVLDRWYYSTLSYQCEHGSPLLADAHFDMLKYIIAYAINTSVEEISRRKTVTEIILNPQIIYLQANADIVNLRIPPTQMDSYETAGCKFYEKVKESYDRLFTNQTDTNVCVIDAMQDPDTISGIIDAFVKSKLAGG